MWRYEMILMINPVHGHLQRRIAASLIPKRPRIRVGTEGLETHQGWHNQVSGAQSGSAPLPPTTIGRKVAKGDQEGQQRRGALF
jgi:hypothetical protein